MPIFQAALSHPVTGRWFAYVNPLFWLVLCRHIGRLHRRMGKRNAGGS